MELSIEHINDIIEHYNGKIWAFVPIAIGECSLGVAIANEPGYYPIPRYQEPNYNKACEYAQKLNYEHLGLTDIQALDIQASTMRGKVKDIN